MKRLNAVPKILYLYLNLSVLNLREQMFFNENLAIYVIVVAKPLG